MNKARIAIGTLLVLGSLRASASVPCAAPPDVRDALKAIDETNDSEADVAITAPRRLAALHKLTEAYPADSFVVQALYEVYAHELGDPAAFRSELTAARARGLDEATALVLDGMLEEDPKLAEPKYRAAIAKDPKSFAAHRALARLLVHAKRFPQARTEAALAVDVCPDDATGYDLLARSKDLKTLALRLRPLRARLDKQTDPNKLGPYETLWEHAFRVATPGADAALRKQVALDLLRLRKLAGDHAPLELLKVLDGGYKRLGDEAGRSWVVAERVRLYPASDDAYNDEVKAWNAVEEKEHGTSIEQRQALAQKKLALSLEWTKKWPKRVSCWDNRLDALRSVPTSPIGEVEATVNKMRAYDTRHFDAIAEAWQHYHTHLVEVAPLVKQALADIEREQRVVKKAFASDPEVAAMIEAQMTGRRFGLWETLALTESERGHRAEAQRVVAEMEHAIPPLATDADDEARDLHKSLEETLSHVNGHLALANKNAADALAAFLHAATLASPDGPPPEPGEDDVRTDAEHAWKALGGSPAGFALLPRGVAKKAESGWKQVVRPMTPFALRDLGGKTWRLKDLKGKIVVINAWATWCGPCKLEMPEVKKLFAKLGGRKDVVLLSFNVDDDVALVAPFVKKNAIGYPVLIAGAVADELIGKTGIPYTMVLDRASNVRSVAIGFDEDAAPDVWMNHALEAIEAAK